MDSSKAKCYCRDRDSFPSRSVVYIMLNLLTPYFRHTLTFPGKANVRLKCEHLTQQNIANGVQFPVESNQCLIELIHIAVGIIKIEPGLVCTVSG